MKLIQMGSSKIKPLTARQRALALAQRFRKIYPDAHCELDFGNPLQLLIATILSAQCTDKRVNMVTPALFKKYPDARAFAKARPATFESEIRSTGFFRSKTKSILGACQAIVAKHDGKVPDTMEELLELPGVARKTANVVLGVAFGKAEGVVVDTHVLRISRRLQLTREDDPKKIEQDLMKLLPMQEWIDFSHRLIWHGRRICAARKPKCDACPIAAECPSAGKIA
jgi:endonuclease-3